MLLVFGRRLLLELAVRRVALAVIRVLEGDRLPPLLRALLVVVPRFRVLDVERLVTIALRFLGVVDCLRPLLEDDVHVGARRLLRSVTRVFEDALRLDAMTHLNRQPHTRERAPERRRYPPRLTSCPEIWSPPSRIAMPVAFPSSRCPAACSPHKSQVTDVLSAATVEFSLDL